MRNKTRKGESSLLYAGIMKVQAPPIRRAVSAPVTHALASNEEINTFAMTEVTGYNAAIDEATSFANAH
jgi:hypothetical protein